jgi:hypothetical protein
LNRGQTIADVVFISYEEPNADENFARLRTLAPHAKRVHHIEGVYNAWTRAAALAETPRFFLVEGDNWILDGFKFREPERPVKADIVMWRARNAVNGLEGLNGCVKCLDREGVFSMDKHAVDLFLSIKGVQRLIQRVVSETRFNTSPFLAWRCGFRECAKLVTGMVDNPRIPELIRIWQTVGKGALNGEWCMLGARMGAEFGRLYERREELKKVNDISWFKTEFEIISRRVGSASPLAVSPRETLLPRA